ncbi:MAG: hypothetical protein IJX44_09465 [Bacteroidaceae bacterium]|nr:hypothetical protein [Bacteroidaceae bacterium]
MNTTVLIVICCILLLPCAIFAIKNYFKEVDSDGEYFWLSIFVAIPIIIILSPIFLFAFLKPLWDFLYYRNRPAPLPKKTRDILKTFVSDRRNVISLAEYNKRHNTNFTLEDVYGEKYVKALKENIITEKLSVIKAFERAWQTLDASIVEPYLTHDFCHTSMWSFTDIENKKEYMDYLTGKFRAIRNGNAPVEAKIAKEGYNGIIITQKDGKEERKAILVISVKDGKAYRADLCMPGICFLTDLRKEEKE